METLSELQRENRELHDRKELLELRQENRDLKRQIKRLESGKTAKMERVFWTTKRLNILGMTSVVMVVFAMLLFTLKLIILW